MDIQSNTKQERDKLVKREGLEKAIDELIHCLIFRQVWDSGWRWKTAGEVKKIVRVLKLRKEKESGLEENIQMHYKGLGQLKATIT